MNLKEILLFIIILNNDFNLILNNIYNLLNNSDMKMITRTLVLKYLAGWLSLFFILFSIVDLNAQTSCMITKDHGQGYTTAIKSVVANSNNSYTIVLDVKSNGCTGTCKAMARYSVQASPGTYSNVSVEVIQGNLNYNNIDLGPNLGGDPFTGFRLTGTAGFGNGNPGEFTITYTLTGGLQNQQTQVKAGGDFLLVSF